MDDFVIENGILKEYSGRERSLVIPDNVERIGDRVFHKNLALRKVIISDSVVYGGWWTFQDCSYLKEVKLSEQMDEICPHMFQNTALESVVIPKKIVEVNSESFADCKSLRKVIFLSDYLEVSVSAFKNSPNVVIYCHHNLCRRLSLAVNLHCYPLEDLDKQIDDKYCAYYEDEAFMESYPDGKPIEKTSTFKVQVGGKELTVRFKPESCMQREFNVDANRWYTFAEVFEHYVSREEALEEYYKEDPNCRSDGFLYVEPRLEEGAFPLSISEVEERMRFLKAVYRGLNNQETAQKLAEYVPKKKNGYLNAAVYTRISCAGVANKALKIPEIVSKAKDETTLEVFVKCMVFSQEEVEKLNTGFIVSSSDKASSEPILEEENQVESSGESIVTEIRCGGVTLPITLCKDDDGEFIHKACGRTVESFFFVRGTPEKGYDVLMDNEIHDEIISQGLSVSVTIPLLGSAESCWKQLAILSEYFHSERDNKAFETFQSAYEEVKYALWEKSDLDNVVDPDNRIEACVIAALCSIEVLMKNHTRYAQVLADGCQRKKNGNLWPYRSGGSVWLTKEVCELYSGTEPYLPQFCGMDPYISSRASGDTKVFGEFYCDPDWD